MSASMKTFDHPEYGTVKFRSTFQHENLSEEDARRIFDVAMANPKDNPPHTGRKKSTIADAQFDG